ncbi:hypothetical protein POM88_020770 [Heracleum sosnowskyi]|uniref:Uncharacterized protein n=1 Tax=Heracleum sosnowskyi TaxID=360622 RepID=A0AAD8IFP6_9APIA|nr:hypothetical protein POM88_020770 [Heracleum sosnowskyi]
MGIKEAARSTKPQRIDLWSNGRSGQRNIIKMDDLNIRKPRGNPSNKLEDENNTSRLEMKEHICMSMLETQIACRRWWMGQKKEKEAIFCSSWPPQAKCCR